MNHYQYPETYCRLLGKELTAKATLPFEDLTSVAVPQRSRAVIIDYVSGLSQRLPLYDLSPYHIASKPSKPFDRLTEVVVGRLQARLASTASMSVFRDLDPVILGGYRLKIGNSAEEECDVENYCRR